MEKGELDVVASALAALYLRGSPFGKAVRRRAWPLVRDSLCREAPALKDVPLVLREAGMWDEATALEVGGALEWGYEIVSQGQALTVASPQFPARWLRVLGDACPPCIWVNGPLPGSPSVAVTGNRQLEPRDRKFCRDLGEMLMGQGCSLVSGGAVGADSAVARAALEAGGAGRVVVVLPCGVRAVRVPPDVSAVSVCQPDAAFSPGQAMERNVLIYASSERAVVVRARFREGGTWSGATEALRRSLCEVLVRRVPGDRAADSLIALGGRPVETVDQVRSALSDPVSVGPRLFTD